MKKDIQVTFGPVTKANVDQLRKINSASFPIQYNDAFYKSIIQSSLSSSLSSSLEGDYTKTTNPLNQVAYVNGTIVGGYCSRIENMDWFFDDNNNNNNNNNCNIYNNTENTSISKKRNRNIMNLNPNPYRKQVNKPLKQQTKQKVLYIMTLAVLAPYRGRGIGTKLLQHLLRYYDNPPSPNHKTNIINDDDDNNNIQQVVLHVQISNQDAIRLYTNKFGFTIGSMCQNYYKRINPPHCYLLYKDCATGTPNNNNDDNNEMNRDSTICCSTSTYQPSLMSSDDDDHHRRSRRRCRRCMDDNDNDNDTH